MATKPKSDAERLAKLAVERVVRVWGRDWRRMISRDVQEAILSHEVLGIVLSWHEPERINAAKVQDIARAAHALMFPPEPDISHALATASRTSDS